MMFPSNETSPRGMNYRTIGMVTIAAALGLMFMVDTDEILHYSYKLNPLLRATAVAGSMTCPECQGVWRPEYDYAADYQTWDKEYGKVQAIRLLGERHSGRSSSSLMFRKIALLTIVGLFLKQVLIGLLIIWKSALEKRYRYVRYATCIVLNFIFFRC